jgi:hypothetical protein
MLHGFQVGDCEAKQDPQLQIVHIEYFVIQSEVENFIGGKDLSLWRYGTGHKTTVLSGF